MALLNFPPNPNIGDTWVIGSTTWQWNGYAWVKYNPIQAGTNDTTITNVVSITTTTNSTSTTTGALVVNGGVGISGNLNVGGNLSVLGNFSSIGISDNATAKSLVLEPGSGRNITFNGTEFFGTASATSGLLMLFNRSDSGSGVYNGPTTVSAFRAANSITFGTSTGTITLGNLTGLGTVTASTAGGGQGALSLQGGAYVGKNLIVMSTASSTATGFSNALYVEGGAYIKNTFTVEGTALFKDVVTFNGTATYVFSTNTVYTDNILHLHTPPGGVDDKWLTDDGKDIGIRIHYYDTTDTNAAFVFANDTKKFEFYKSGAEGTSTFTSGVYAGLVAGNLKLNDTTATSNTYTGALVVSGGVGIGGNIIVGGNITVGAVTTDTTVSAITSNNLNLSSYTKTGITGSSSVDLDSYSSSDYRSSKYFIQIVDGGDVHVTEMSIFHNGTNVYKTEYGYHYNNGILGTFGAAYTASTVVLSFQPISAANMTIKVVRFSITP